MGFEWLDTYDRIIAVCRRYKVERVVLFGSRARGTNTRVSDIDIVVYGAEDFDRLFAELKYNEFTLKIIDIINGDEELTEELLAEIKRDGVILYEKDK